jgi:hypothetical protein
MYMLNLAPIHPCIEHALSNVTGDNLLHSNIATQYQASLYDELLSMGSGTKCTKIGHTATYGEANIG